MSNSKEFETYTEKFAKAYCEGNVEKAKEQAMVNSVKEYYEECGEN